MFPDNHFSFSVVKDRFNESTTSFDILFLPVLIFFLLFVLWATRNRQIVFSGKRQSVVANVALAYMAIPTLLFFLTLPLHWLFKGSAFVLFLVFLLRFFSQTKHTLILSPRIDSFTIRLNVVLLFIFSCTEQEGFIHSRAGYLFDPPDSAKPSPLRWRLNLT